MRAILILGLLAVVPLSAQQKLVVAKDGSGRFSALQAAVDASGPGDVILIKAGDYFESVRIDGKSDLTIEGRGNVWLKADGDSEILTVNNSTGIVVRGINGIHTSEGGCYNNVFGIFDSRGVAFYDCIANGSGIYGFDISGSTGVILADNNVVHCSSVGISIDKATYVSAVRNVISENRDWRTLSIGSSAKVIFKNNTIVRNVGIPLVMTDSREVQFYNNIIAFNHHTDDKKAVLNATEGCYELNFQHNIVYSNESVTGQVYDFDNMGTETVVADHLALDPRFVDVSSGDYRLGRNSPAVRSGFGNDDIGAITSANTDDASHWLWLANGAYGQREFDVALFFYQAVLARRSNDTTAHIGAGNAYLNMRRFDNAAFHYQQTLDLDRDNVSAMYNFACLYSLKYEITTALDWLERALRAGFHDRQAIDTDADLLNLRDQPRFYDLMKKYLPGTGDAEFDEGVRYYQAGDWQNAERVFQAVASKKPQMAEARYYLGLIAELRQLYVEALSHYSMAVSLRPNYSEAFLGMGNAYFGLQNFYEAAEQYRRCLQLDPNQVSAYSNLGAVYAIQKDITTAEHYLMQGYRIKPDDATLCYNLACLFSLQHQTEKALEFLERAFQNGYRDVEHMNQDSDLDFIRDHPRFKDLVRIYGGRR
jgi:Flp pilus assembly protein TadD